MGDWRRWWWSRCFCQHNQSSADMSTPKVCRDEQDGREIADGVAVVSLTAHVDGHLMFIFLLSGTYIV